MRKKNFDVERCCGCNGRIRFGARTGVNTSWHKRCWKAHEAGAATAKRYINSMLLSLDYPSVDALQAKIPKSTAGDVYQRVGYLSVDALQALATRPNLRKKFMARVVEPTNHQAPGDV